jgi:3-isopropylmalate/(R)-2-methylmalate dehydratase small subunit
MLLQGKVLKYGDNVDTDAIIAGKYTKTLDLQDLADHAMEDLDPDFRTRLKPGDFMVAGKNFGCGSSREQAPIALKQAGVACVVARAFARIFYRNAINIGLPLVECDVDAIGEGDILQYELGGDRLLNLTRNGNIPIRTLPDIMVAILTEGGLVNYLKRFGSYRM